MDEQYLAFKTILDMHDRWIQLRYEHWIAHEAYTGMWWFLVVATVLPWCIWIFLVERRRFVSLSFYGLKVMFASTFLNAMGTTQSLWLYTVKVIPFTPHLEPIDWSILPVTYMLVYQYFPRWKGFIFAQVVLAGVLAFVGEPFATKIMGVYIPIHWKIAYSFPIYIALGIIPRISTEFFYRIERNRR
jgi:hypothetical protein